MGASQPKGDGQPVPPGRKQSTVILLLTLSDTTWRLFIPSIGGTLAGLYLDKRWSSQPWMMILGIMLGGTLAMLLVKRQLRRIN